MTGSSHSVRCGAVDRVDGLFGWWEYRADGDRSWHGDCSTKEAAAQERRDRIQKLQALSARKLDRWLGNKIPG